MKIHMTFRQMEATEALKRQVNEKSERLRKFADGPVELNWIFYLEKEAHVADLRVQGPHVDFFAQAKTTDLYQSIEEAVDKMETQLRRNKEMVKDHLHRQSSERSRRE